MYVLLHVATRALRSKCGDADDACSVPTHGHTRDAQLHESYESNGFVMQAELAIASMELEWPETGSCSGTRRKIATLLAAVMLLLSIVATVEAAGGQAIRHTIM